MKQTVVYEMIVTYFIIDEQTEEVLATTKQLKMAEFIRDNYPTKTVIRSDVKTVPKLKAL